MVKADKTYMMNHGSMGFAAFVAFVGAFLYFVNQAHNFGEGVLAFLKALVWPGFLIYHVLQTLGA